MYPTVTIIVLNWNGWENTIECLESLYNIEYVNYYLILVDNASNDDSIKKIKEYCNGNLKLKSNYFKYRDQNKPIHIKEIYSEEIKQIELEENLINSSTHQKNLLFIKNDRNYGFAEGNNIAIRFAMENLNQEYVLLLNNDTVVDKKFLNELINVAIKKDNIGFIGPKIYKYDQNAISNIISFAGGHLNAYTTQPHPRGADQLDVGQFDNNSKVDYVEGSCIIIKKDIINRIGLLDQEYFTYWEEIDWCIRGEKVGFDSIYAYKSIVWHKGYSSDLICKQCLLHDKKQISVYEKKC